MRLIAINALVLLSIALIPSWGSDSVKNSDLEKRLKADLVGKSFFLHGFCKDSVLDIDAHGNARKCTPGNWFVDGRVRVTDVSLSSDRITMSLEHMYLFFDQGKWQIAEAPSGNQTRLTIDFGADSMDDLSVRTAIGGAFLNRTVHLADVVPDYWRKVAQKIEDGSPWEHPSQKKKPKKKVMPAVDPVLSATPCKSYGEITAYRVGRQVTPPKGKSIPEPEYTEMARAVQLQGEVVVELIVDENGKPQDLMIARPMGMGLDDAAVDKIRTWTFKPGLKDGKPVATCATVEIAFSLYR